ncbi:hypothetical protein MMC29_003141 [Sticta canariensis]|nr:hypothetical protein [Sticta canariensis]
MPGRVPSVKFLQRVKNPAKRQLIQNLTLAVWNTPDCEHFKDVLIKNPRHTSHSDGRPHITLRMKTARQVAEQSGQTVHVYYNEQTKQYEAFRLYSERKDDSKKDEPKDE